MGSEKYVSPFPKPTDYEREIYTITIEECCEVSHRLSKIMRFGADEIQKGHDRTNAYRMSEEIGNLLFMIDLMEEKGLLINEAVQAGIVAKEASLEKYAQTQPTEPEKAITLTDEDNSIFKMALGNRLSPHMETLPFKLKNRANELIDAGLMERTSDGIRLTPKGSAELVRSR